MNEWYPQNRGKVRGWTRRTRHVEEWRQRHLALNESALSADGRGYAKLWIDPWYRLVRREPPAWLRRRMVAALLDVHRAWHERLTRHEQASGEPFDCMVWLLAPHVIESQVVFASGEMQAFYRGTFPHARSDVPLTPPEAVYGPGVAALNWTPVYVPGYTTAEDLAEDSEWARIFERRWRRHVLSETEIGSVTQIQYRVGHGWVGRLSESMAAGGTGM